ncbi:uncharacterized protein F5891DRAFT_975631 [Suillus fuscotomentosus]|uniref:Alpha-type protein kinase domain-containing protein n=1 Tax=Suillus fuscotomentosus TaxID=1912939 RepID=A0AAD4EHK0_9AGAM|nr:uncharacterized protein F5891DRAFT_975631 [Suillus fuscotomentosus]KAG1906201.1 hypothetical protein F5891DRAFT_975631 [Suillus fuscotomentosus]
MYAAEFTTNADQHYCEYANCFSGHPGTVPAITYIEHKDPSKPGKWLCDKCSRYQRSKFTTKKISDAVIPNTSKHGFGQSEYDGAAVHKQTAEVQRGKSQLPVRAVGLSVSCGMPPPAFIPGPVHPRRASANHQFVPLPNWPAAPGPSDIRRANPLGPNISIYGRDPQFIVYSDLLQTLPLKPGYQDAHKIYEEMRDRLARQAYASSVPEVVCVKAYLAVMIPRAKKPTLISDIVESISNIPYRIGANDLKTSVYLTLLPMFIKWSMGLTFTFEEAHLRLVSSFEEILPRPSGEDINAIASHFLKTRNMKQQFNAGKGIELHLIIPHTKFLATEQRRNAYINQDTPHATAASSSDIQHLSSPALVLSAVSPSKNLQNGIQCSPHPVKRKLSSHHTQPPVPSTPPQKPRTLDAAVSPDYGAFKAAQFGFLDKAILGPSGSDSTRICLKQCYYQTDKSKRFPYPDSRQLQLLQPEIRCSIWAGALMDRVQQYIATELVTCSTPPFKIPNIRFMHIALATIEDAGVTKTYLIEEFIDESMQGKFTKYISNDSPSPLPHLDANSSEIAQYLSFAQHVQYIKTKKLAYVADFQGSSLFWISTHSLFVLDSDLSGHLFADGNLASAFSSFVEKHRCNMFCEFFKLPWDWSRPIPPLFHKTPEEVADSERDSESDDKSDDFGKKSMVLGTRDDISKDYLSNHDVSLSGNGLDERIESVDDILHSCKKRTAHSCVHTVGVCWLGLRGAGADADGVVGAGDLMLVEAGGVGIGAGKVVGASMGGCTGDGGLNGEGATEGASDVAFGGLHGGGDGCQLGTRISVSDGVKMGDVCAEMGAGRVGMVAAFLCEFRKGSHEWSNE